MYTEAAVIGAGIVGTCCALSLQAEGLRVTLIDRGEPGEGCSKGNAGHLAVENIVPIANLSTVMQVPGMLVSPNGPLTLRWRYLPRLLPWLAKFVAAARPKRAAAAMAAVAALNRQALPAYEWLGQLVDLTDLIRREGTLLVCETRRGFAQIRARSELLARHGIRTETLGPAELRSFDPALAPNLAGGLFFPDSGHVVNPHRLVVHLAERFQHNGGRLIRAQVERLVPTDSQCRLETSAGAVQAGLTVIAAGAWSGKLAAQVGHVVPLDTERGYHFMALDPSLRPRAPTIAHEQSFVVTPMEHGVRVAGRVELGGLHLPMNPRRAEHLLPLAQRLFPGFQTRRSEIWMGFRPTLADCLPIIDRSERHPGVFFAFGHHHLGLTQAAITGRLISDIAVGRQPRLDINAFRVDRFGRA